MQPDSHLRQCRHKVRHESMESAQDAAKQMHKKKKARFTAYPCPHCNGFHVGQDRSLAAAYRRSERRLAKAAGTV